VKITIVFRDGRRETLAVASYARNIYVVGDALYDEWGCNGLKGERWVVPANGISSIVCEADSAGPQVRGAAAATGVDHNTDRKGAEDESIHPETAPRESHT
jgi:hypothetical protein